MSTTLISSSELATGKALRIGLWSSQLLVFVLFTLFGAMKLLMPVDKLAAMWHWPAQVPVWFLHLTGILDTAGGVGILLPAVTRILPRLTVWAALGCTSLQIAALIFHLSRGEAGLIPLNIFLLALAAFVLWGRGIKDPIAS